MDRLLFNEGLPQDQPLFFATYGEPVFERLVASILQQVEQIPFKIIETEVDGISTAGIVYSDETGRSQFITSVSQALKVQNIGSVLSEQAIERSKIQLEQFCKAESKNINKIEGIEKNKLLQAQAQVALSNQIIRSLITSKLNTGRVDDIAPVMLKSLDEQFANRDTPLRVSNVPRELEHILKAGLVPPKFPVQGDGHIDTPVLIVQTALDSLARRIDGSRTLPKKQTASGIVEAINKMPVDLS